MKLTRLIPHYARRGLKAPAGAAALILLMSTGLSAQSSSSETKPLPFGPGERALYEVRLGVFGSVGEGAMEVLGIEEVRGRPTYHARLTIKGRVLFASVDNRLESWMDMASLVARRFEQEQDEVRTDRHRVYEFYPEEMRWVMTNKLDDTQEEGELPTDMPLDQVSFLYFARTLPLEVGETYSFDRYFQDRGNPVVLRVLRRETVTVPAGTFDTIVVQPVIQTRGLFSEGGRAEVYFTDDDRRLLVQMKSRVPVIGSLNLFLESYTPGEVALTGGASDRR